MKVLALLAVAALSAAPCAPALAHEAEAAAGAAKVEPVPGRRPDPSAFVAEAMAQLHAMQPLPAKAARPMALVGVNVIPMTRDRVLKDQTIILRDGKIEKIGARKTVKVPADVEALNLTGKYVIPGLSDMHIHLDGGLPQALPFFIVNGVTNIRSMDGQPLYLEWRERIERGEMLGPRIATTGPILDGQPGPGRVVVTSADEARAEVARQYEAGFRAIKTYTWLSAEAYRAAVEEAKARGMFVTGHIPDAVGVSAAFDLGPDEVAHIGELREAFYVNYNPKEVFAEYIIDESKVDGVVKRMKKERIALNTTLDMLNAMGALSAHPDAYLARPAFKDAPPVYRMVAAGQSNMWANLLKPDYINGKVIPFFNERLILALQRGGVLLVLGTDAPVMGTGVVWGTAVHEELELLVKAGFTPYEALRTATVNPAIQAKAVGQYGAIVKGAAADLVVLDANPLKDIGAIRRIHGVSRIGQWYVKDDFENMMASVRDSYESSAGGK